MIQWSECSVVFSLFWKSHCSPCHSDLLQDQGFIFDRVYPVCFENSSWTDLIINMLSLVGIQLSEKYKENFDVSSESPSSGVTGGRTNYLKWKWSHSSWIDLSDWAHNLLDRPNQKWIYMTLGKTCHIQARCIKKGFFLPIKIRFSVV
jgi:hypothetical protein